MGRKTGDGQRIKGKNRTVKGGSREQFQLFPLTDNYFLLERK
ncbi:hypothetical protein GTCCBUS3UF5_9760 [Geobacillus thermoleovorans CCB_US3_UF5]|uniref:Uncharacterized protein n=2 Tax=Geobacillus thermoleovorans group TaxID=1505648 RepID=U2X3Y1_GEOKU|nr:hypothetical protein GTCCBUS3UF5_9760 [Geobacillus thermoleovorans CCB_US3_UF5]GAD13312.1 hypothetical protein GBL_1529 [Geobacillus kaustophilus GBlys]